MSDQQGRRCTFLDTLALAIADNRGVDEVDRTNGMMAVFRMDATSVVKAMFEPTEAMMRAGILDGDATYAYETWQEMIRVILEEPINPNGLTVSAR